MCSRLVVPALVVLAALVHSPRAAAVSKIVPDDFATIQGAIATAPDTIFVRPGTYDEDVTVNAALVLLGLPPTYGAPLPYVRSLTATLPALSTGLVMRGLRFRRRVDITGGQAPMQVESCRMDSTFSCFIQQGGLRQCTIHGDAHFQSAYIAEVSQNTVVAGDFFADGDGNTEVHDNSVLGPGVYGLTCGEDTQVRNNYVRNYVTGIRAACSFSVVSGNLVEDCSGTGIVLSGSTCGGTVIGNVVRRCDEGIRVETVGGAVTGNWIEDITHAGIRTTNVTQQVDGNTVLRAGTGITSAGVLVLQSNRVISSGGDGIVLGLGGLVEHNVVGRSGGRGIVVGDALGSIRLRWNTCYLNGAYGFAIANTAAGDSIRHNIAAANQGGLTWSGGVAPTLACNDWFNNFGANTSGLSPGATDVFVSPDFCNLPNNDVSLSTTSPLANLPGCGLVGALAVGCVTASGVAPDPAARVQLRAWPLPATGAVHLRWSPLPVVAEIALYDVAGGVWWRQVVAARAGEATWNRSGLSGREAVPGVYFARLRAPGIESTTRVVLTR